MKVYGQTSQAARDAHPQAAIIAQVRAEWEASPQKVPDEPWKNVPSTWQGIYYIPH